MTFPKVFCIVVNILILCTSYANATNKKIRSRANFTGTTISTYITILNTRRASIAFESISYVTILTVCQRTACNTINYAIKTLFLTAIIILV